MNTKPAHPSPGLLPAHQALLDASCIAPEVAAARGYRSVTVQADLLRLGFARSQRLVPALLIPVRDVHGQVATYQSRPDTPRIRDGKPLKYETPAGSSMVLDVPPSVRPRLADPATPLFITEGVRKADSAASQGLACIALLGVWNWRGTNDRGGKAALPDWESIALNGRTVYIAFDSDVMEKPGVHAALDRLKPFLETRGASVHIIYLPPGPGGAKQGLDDFFAAGQTVTDLLACATPHLRPLPAGIGTPPAGSYSETPSGLVWHRRQRVLRVTPIERAASSLVGAAARAWTR